MREKRRKLKKGRSQGRNHSLFIDMLCIEPTRATPSIFMYSKRAIFLTCSCLRIYTCFWSCQLGASKTFATQLQDSKLMIWTLLPFFLRPFLLARYERLNLSACMFLLLERLEDPFTKRFI
jgi:hypothetical protein